MHNVDVVPIILDLLDLKGPALDGFNSLNRSREWGYNHFENMFYTTGLDRFDRTVRSVWDKQGGRVQHTGGRLHTTAIFFGLLLKSIHGKRIRTERNLIDAYKRFTGSQDYGTPQFTEEEFKSVLKNIDAGESGTAERQELSDEEVEHLKDLGYI